MREKLDRSLKERGHRSKGYNQVFFSERYIGMKRLGDPILRGFPRRKFHAITVPCKKPWEFFVMTLAMQQRCRCCYCPPPRRRIFVEKGFWDATSSENFDDFVVCNFAEIKQIFLSFFFKSQKKFVAAVLYVPQLSTKSIKQIATPLDSSTIACGLFFPCNLNP